MDTKLIECKLIDVPKADNAVRTFNKDFAVRLANSLKVDGQLNAIVVRLNPAMPGRYILVAGRHRLYAMKNVLKERLITASIHETMDEAKAAIIADVDNLWRNPLGKAQDVGALKRWHDHWLVKRPPLAVTARKSSAQNEARRDAAIADLTGHPIGMIRDIRAMAASSPEYLEALATMRAARTIRQSGENPHRPARSAAEADFGDKVAATNGQPPRPASRINRIGHAFTADQMNVFAQMDVNLNGMFQVAKIEDESLRARAVELIASGMVVADAIREVCKDANPARETGKSKAAVEAKVNAKLRRPAR